MTQALRHPDLPHARAANADGELDYSMLIEAGEAAGLLGKHRDAMTRDCRDRLRHQGLAVYAAPPNGGNPRWWVDRRHDLRLAPGSVGEQYQTPQLGHYPREKVREAWDRAACVERLRKMRAHERRPVKQWLPGLIDRLNREMAGLKVSQSRLYAWDKAYQTPADLVELIDKRGGNQTAKADPACWTYFRKVYLDPRQPTVRACWRKTRAHAKAQGMTWCSYSACSRHLRDHISEEEDLINRDPKRWRQQMRPYVEQDPEAFAAGDCWVGDHAQLDMWVRHGKSLIRPWITAWMDWRTRKVVGHAFSVAPNSSTILQSFRAGLLDKANHGGPSTVWVDNGKDYACWSFHGATRKQRENKRFLPAGYMHEGEVGGLFGLLNIEVHFSIPHNPNGKSRMERWFLTMHELFDREFATYCGRSQEHKPEGLERILNKQVRVPTFEQVAGHLDKFIGAYNARNEHSIKDLADDQGEAVSPDHAMAQWCNRTRALADPSVLDLFAQQWHKPVRANRNGITISPFGKNLSFGGDDLALSRYKALAVKDRPYLHVSYDPADLSSIRVFDEHYRFICETCWNQLGGRHDGGKVSRFALQEHMRRQRKYRDAMQTVADNRELEMYSDAELIALGNRDDTPPEPKGPDRLEVVQTPVDGQMEEVQKDKLRKAAGAENLSDQDDDFDFEPASFPAPAGGRDQPDEDDEDGALPPLSLDDLSPPEDGQEADDLHEQFDLADTDVAPYRFPADSTDDDEDEDLLEQLR